MEVQAPTNAAGAAMVTIPAGEYRIGSDRFYPEEAPSRLVTLAAFQIAQTPVTNAQFAAFVAASGYRTVSELPPDPAIYPGLSREQRQPASAVFRPLPSSVDRANPIDWWALVPGANWRHPQGPASGIDGLDQHPVVHIAWADALAYCAWSGLRLPTAREWEVAALAQFLLLADSVLGLVDNDYSWGNELNPQGQWMANTWQGVFPWENLTADGWFWTSPVGHYPANGYGLVDMAGNVWEWTSTPFPTAAGLQDRQVVKGGSFLCADNYCMRYRPSAFIAQTLDTATCHMGFRCAADAAAPAGA